MRRGVALAAAALMAGGCAVAPDYKRPDTNLPASYAEAQGRAGDASAVPAQWWKLYRDPVLDSLVAAVLERNADIRLAVARIEEADANLREANAAFLPQIDLGATGSRSRVSTRTAVPLPPGSQAIRNDVRAALSTAFELDLWGRIRGTAEALRAQALATRYARDVVELTLAGLATQAYFSLRALDAQIAVTRETLASREESLRYIRARAAGGLVSDLDVSQAQTARADAGVQLLELERQRRLIVHQLGNLAGTPDLPVTAGDLRTLAPPPLPPPGLPSTLLERRPDIRQAEQALIAANAQIAVARANMLPAISLTGALGAQSRALASLLESGAGIWSLGFGLGLPLFDWGRYEARSDAARARERQAVAGYQRAVEAAFREVSDALSNLRQATAAEADLGLRLEATRRTLRLARLRYDSGYSGFLEVLDAQRTANDAELAYLRNRQAVLAATVDLMKALGGGWSPGDAAPGAAQQP